MDRHVSKNHSRPIVDLDNCFDGGIDPQWIEVESVDSFVNYVNEYLIKTEDTMLVYGSSSHEQLRTLATHHNWGYHSRGEIRGSEASFVILFDIDQFDYEVFTRAKHRLLIVTMKRKR